ncbi:MAG: hypothetical protein JO100_08830 [Pseudonocardia sp.]|nr:hypothetical protein [Pseudonocardia sp.]
MITQILDLAATSKNTIDSTTKIGDDVGTPNEEVIMASMRKRGSRRRYQRTVIAAARLFDDRREVSIWLEQERLSDADSPP